MSYQVINPFIQFIDPINGNPLSAGTVYFGRIDSDPKNQPANRINVYAVQDNGSEVLLSQPITLNGAGQPQYSGSVKQIKIELYAGESAYAIQLFSKNGAQKGYSPRVYGVVDLLNLGAPNSTVSIAGVEAKDLAAQYNGIDTSGVVFAINYGVVADGSTDNTAAYNAARASAGNGATIVLPEGVVKGNFKVENNQRLIGAGRFKTILIAADNTKPVVLVSDADGGSFLDTLFLYAASFSIYGYNTAQIGLQIGVGPSPNTATYCKVEDVYVFECVDNIDVRHTIGAELNNVFSYYATNRGIVVKDTAIVTLLEITHCNFNQNKTGMDLRGGALIKITDSGVESNKDVGAYLIRDTTSGSRQMLMENVWFEDNGYAPTTGAASSIFIDQNPINVPPGANYMDFKNCIISSPNVIPDVNLNRGNNVFFRMCTFTDINSTRLVFNAGNGEAFAELHDCGTINSKPRPALYASAPELNEIAATGKIQGFLYKYTFNGLQYTNALHQAARIYAGSGAVVANITGNGAVYTTAALALASTLTPNYNYGGIVSAGKFTVPVKGIYDFYVCWPISDMSTAMSAAEVFFIVNPDTSPTTYSAGIMPLQSPSSATYTFTGAAKIRVGTGDVVVAAIKVSGGVGDTASFNRDLSGDFGRFNFSVERI